jgi:gliding motility-associated-like protein
MIALKKVLLLCIIFCLSLKAYPAVFVVTSNANSGPGTFNNALLQAAANGSAEKDYINFNLPDTSQTGRTITITSQLPDVSSNLVIDGSTQTGRAFGVSSAKVAILFNSTGQSNFSALNITNQTDVAVYGLYLNLTNQFNSQISHPVGIYIKSTNNMQLGDVNKGNVINGFFYPVEEDGDNVSESLNLILKSNFFSILPDGLTTTSSYFPSFANVYGNIIVGGTPAEGNLFAKGVSFEGYYSDQAFTLLFRNNLSGVNYNLTGSFDNAIVVIDNNQGNLAVSTGNSVVTVEDNIMCNNGVGSVCLLLGELGGVTNVVRNYMNVNRLLKQLATSTFGIYVQICQQTYIGDSNTSDANYIGYCQAIFAEDVINLAFNHNIFFCGSNGPIYFDSHNEVRNQCHILSINSNTVSGTSAPNAQIELFYSDICNDCVPQHYFASTTADANGNWSYTGALNGDVIASATANNATSDFTKVMIDTTNLKISNECNGNDGSITGIMTYSAETIKWTDSGGNIVGAGNDLQNLKPGKYTLTISNSSCTDTAAFEIYSSFTVNENKVVQSGPDCDGSDGYVTGLKVTDPAPGSITYTWTDTNGKVWGNKIDLTNVPAGIYSLLISRSDGCSKTYGPVTLQDQSEIVPLPIVFNVMLCVGGETLLQVRNVSPGYTYRLYDSPTSITPIDEEPTGVFKIDVDGEKFYYVTQVLNKCESARVSVRTISNLQTKDIPNAFTPNNDSINDYWAISNIEKYPNAIVQVFSRFGELVYQSKGYGKPFDGTHNGTKLPVGVYYYIINLNSGCGLFSGSLSLIR